MDKVYHLRLKTTSYNKWVYSDEFIDIFNKLSNKDISRLVESESSTKNLNWEKLLPWVLCERAYGYDHLIKALFGKVFCEVCRYTS